MKKTSKLSACLSGFLKFAALHQKLFILGALTLAILFPFLITDRYVLRLAVVGFMYVMLSLGLNLVTGYMGQMSFGHAAFWGIGAYTAALLTKNLGLGTLPAFLAAAIVVGIFGFLLGLIPMALIIGLLTRREKCGFWRMVLACVAGLVVLYAIGLPYMYFALNVAWSVEKTLESGCEIFLPFDAMKIALASLLGCRLQRVLRR